MIRRALIVTHYEHEEEPFLKMFEKVIYTTNPKEVPKDSVILFGGGTDINPMLYGENPGSFTEAPDKERDLREVELFVEGRDKDCGFIGVCRGAQLLAVLSNNRLKGTLIQNAGGHNGEHSIHTADGIQIMTSSVHHQMINMDRLVEPYNLLAYIGRRDSHCKVHMGENDEVITPPDYEIEMCWFNETHALCIQGHPELPYCQPDSKFTRFCQSQVRINFE